MRRPILFNQNKKKIDSLQKQSERQTSIQSDLGVEERLRKKRSKDYIDTFSDLDVQGQVLDQEGIRKLIKKIQDEFPEYSLDSLEMQGIVGKCYLGEPYEVHTLSLDLEILKHYKIDESLPNELEKARNMALNSHYCFVEVYNRFLRAVKWNGEVSVVKG